jgi:hypothetical protein
MSTPTPPAPTPPAGDPPTPPAPPPAGDPKPPAEPTSDELRAQLDEWKANARKHEERAKQNADAAKRLAAIEDANKSETERLSGRVTEFEKRAIEAERALLQSKVGAAAGLPPALWDRLRGEDEAAMAEDAKSIIAFATPPIPPKPTPPAGDVGAGTGGTGSTDDLGNLSMEEYRKRRAAERAG